MKESITRRSYQLVQARRDHLIFLRIWGLEISENLESKIVLKWSKNNRHPILKKVTKIQTEIWWKMKKLKKSQITNHFHFPLRRKIQQLWVMSFRIKVTNLLHLLQIQVLTQCYQKKVLIIFLLKKKGHHPIKR
jgi:hypothetical protein